tara:strand:+ start:76 stop:948 length:873 start_codon:yes stop_codon:yes gene_type:complete
MSFHTSYLDTIHYKLGHKLFTLLQTNQLTNTIIYGPINSGKTHLITTILHELFGDTQNQLLLDKSNYLSNSYYTLFNCRKIGNKKLMIDKIKSIVKSYNYYKDTYQYIILDNFEAMNSPFQNILKVIFEKSYLTSRFIIITNRLNYIIKPLRSHLILLKIRDPHSFDKMIHYKLKEENNKGLKELNYIQDIHLNRPIKTIVSQSIQLFQSPFNMKAITDISNTIKLMNLSYNELFQELLHQLSKHYSTKILINITHILSDYEYKLLNSFRDIIYIESIFIHIYSIIHGLL